VILEEIWRRKFENGGNLEEKLIKFYDDKNEIIKLSKTIIVLKLYFFVIFL